MKAAMVLVVWVSLWASATSNAGSPTPNTSLLYDPDPRHLWNRLNDVLFVRTAPDNGEQYGSGELDILFRDSTKHLLACGSHEKLEIPSVRLGTVARSVAAMTAPTCDTRHTFRKRFPRKFAPVVRM